MTGWVLSVIIVANGHIYQTQADKGYWLWSDCKQDLEWFNKEVAPKKGVALYAWCDWQ